MIIEVPDEHLLDLKILLQRALNTWDKAPKWAYDLADKVDVLTKENPHGTGNDGS